MACVFSGFRFERRVQRLAGWCGARICVACDIIAAHARPASSFRGSVKYASDAPLWSDRFLRSVRPGIRRATKLASKTNPPSACHARTLQPTQTVFLKPSQTQTWVSTVSGPARITMVIQAYLACYRVDGIITRRRVRRVSVCRV